ncbi:efflux RND transporter permease subunit [Gammaproteobacteria bacterium]|nr:efflux RND transporter permease subunit [Gammaproteobacteria bacterium]
MIEWFARNGVAANLLMIVIFFMGIWALTSRVPLEVFPEFESDVVNITMSYRGATPVEVEESIVIRIEEAIEDLQDVERIVSNANEGVANVRVELLSGANPRAVLDDIKNRVDAISTFPENSERPTYSTQRSKREVISVVVSADLPERELRELGERVREDLIALPLITQVELTAVRPYEISIEVSEQTLDRYQLTFDAVVNAIKSSSVDLPAGSIKTNSGEILLRTRGQAYVKSEFDDIVVLRETDGTRITVGDIATVHDGFEEEALYALLNGQPAVLLEVYRVGDQSAIGVGNAVKQYVEDNQWAMPEGVRLDFWRDRSRIVKLRLNTLLRSALQGGLLIFILLALFLRFSVAIWVCLGIPISFMGAIALLPELGVTINLISLFAFILVLGIVVDDAIVTGENIYTHLKRDNDPTEAAIRGTHEIAIPVTFGVLTTVAAFIPLLMISGHRGPIFAQIPMIVIPVLLFSLVESKLILPAHMKHIKIKTDAELGWLQRVQRGIADGLERFIRTVYQPVLARALRRRLLTLAMFIGVAIIVASVVISGRFGYTFFPRIESETARVTLVMPEGTPVADTTRYIQRIGAAAKELRDKYTDPESGQSVIRQILLSIGWTARRSRAGSAAGRPNLGQVSMELVPPEDRTLKIGASDLLRELRELTGAVPGAKELSFRAEIGRGGDPIDVQLAGQDFEQLSMVAELVKARLMEYPGVFDIQDTIEDGKDEIELTIKPQAELLGLDAEDLGRQVRQAFFGAEVQRIQRGREDVRVMVRYPKQQRRSIDSLYQMRIRAPSGAQVPFANVADAKIGRSYSTIQRIDRNRVVNVRADVNKKLGNVPQIVADLRSYLDGLRGSYPAVRYTFEGEQREQSDSFGSLYFGALFVLFAIYSLLAIPFRSYLQPIIVMLIIPFSVVGAILGHMIMGMNLSIMSIMGLLALAGVVVNDSLVLVDWINRRRREGIELIDAVRNAGVARFRAILLTSLTTFAGLMPLIFEKSTQAQFLIPMAVSLGFGILFATFITLILVPVCYLLLEDIIQLFRPRPARASA